MSNEELSLKVFEQAEKLRRYKSELKRAVNELCLRCGQYQQEHLGACDGCHFKGMRSGDITADS